MAVEAKRKVVALSDNARLVLERRYLAKDEHGRVVETPEQLFRRVAHNVAQAELTQGDAKQAGQWEERFYEAMTSLRFLPNSPTLGNAGQPLQQLAACFVLPVEDSMEGIFGAVRNMAMIHKSGGGTGFSFSRLRPAGDMVRSTAGLASGPVSFMRVFDAATEAIKQGGTRRGANMAILAVDHPDIEEFIRVKADMVTLTNFNISVAVSEEFMRAVERDEEYALVNPRTHRPRGKRRARDIFRQTAENAWRNGDPGLVFIDRVNRDNPTPHLGLIEATNPCGEQPLLPYESCNLGSLNLSRFVKEAGTGPETREVDWDALAATIPVCVRFLDDVIDVNHYPIPEIEEMTKKTRKIGLGVMGWADLLFQLRIPYDSEEALRLGERMMAFIQEKADAASEELAGERGVFPAWEESIYARGHGKRRLRNSTRTTVAPTGTLSIIADCSGGIEPVFSLAFTRRHFLDSKQPRTAVKMTEVNKHFERAAREGGFHSKKLIDALAAGAALRDQPKAPDWAKTVFVAAHDVSPECHVRMQAAFQRHTDNAVSKTINFPEDATPDDVEKAYLLAYREGCKGITIYRDNSREMQVLSHATIKGPEQQEAIAAERSLGREAGPPSLRPGEPYHRHLPDQRNSVTHKFRLEERFGEGKKLKPPPTAGKRGKALPARGDISTGVVCPECGSLLVYTEGCLTCRSCGYEKCG